MGLLNLSSPILGWLDLQLVPLLPDAARLVMWAIVASVLSMALYKLLSPQQRIVRVRDEAARAQRALNDYADNLSGAWPLMGKALRLSFLRVGLVLPAALIGGLPVLLMIVWLSTAYSHVFPAPGTGHVTARVEPGEYQARWEGVDPVTEQGRIVVTDSTGAVVTDVVMRKPVPEVTKRHWWNVLIGNPAGYLPSSAPVERIEIDFPRREMIGLGASWMRSWEALFFTVLIACSLAIKYIARIA